MRTAMLVDDNHLSVEGLKLNIDWKNLGIQVTQLQYNGFAACKVLDNETIDLIISDIDMPGMNGLELSKQALIKNPFVKIILISAFDKFEFAKQAVRIGAFDYIEKPIDYPYLETVIRKAQSLSEQERKNIKIVEESKPAITANFFHKLLYSNREENRYSLATYPDYLDLELNCHYYMVLTFKIANANHIKTQIGIKQYHIYLYTLSDHIAALCKDFELSYLIHDLNGINCILGHNYAKAADFQQEVYMITDKIEAIYRDKLFHVHIGIGSIIKYLWDMPVSYSSARHALEYRFFFPQKNIFDARDMGNKNQIPLLFEENQEEQLIQLICKKAYVQITDWIQIFVEGLLDNYKTKNLIFVRIYSILGRILKFLYEMGINSQDMEEEIAKVYSNPDVIHNSVEFISWLNSICIRTCDKLEISTKTYHKQLCESILLYIHEHYENSDLCLNEIAEYANVSPAHLSALYKKSTGVNISDVITSVRIEGACQLLEHTKLSLKEISEKVGYTNQYYFSACFKKKMGKNPSSYRGEQVEN